MPIYQRSQFGCWTCRVRKKKCDETYPTCSCCSTRGIMCHGYGPRPEWLDGGEREKTVVEKLKRVIKENRRKERLANSKHPNQYNTGTSLRSGAVGNTAESSPAISTSSASAEICQTRPQRYDLESISTLALPTPPQRSLEDAKEIETTLLMNYLDHVFPIQFNCYTPPVTELGRGWLLALLTRTKPLYHAALALSAFYMHSILLNTGRKISSDRQWEQMEMHYSLAFRELQPQITGLKDSPNLKSAIETLACVIQLISFEVCIPLFYSPPFANN